jgi:hypothetical protein
MESFRKRRLRAEAESTIAAQKEMEKKEEWQREVKAVRFRAIIAVFNSHA